jgi:hypothetical protein
MTDVIAPIPRDRSRDRCTLRSWTKVVAEDGCAAAARPSAIPGYEDWPTYVRTRPGYSAHSRPAGDLGSALGAP